MNERRQLALDPCSFLMLATRARCNSCSAAACRTVHARQTHTACVCVPCMHSLCLSACMYGVHAMRSALMRYAMCYLRLCARTACACLHTLHACMRLPACAACTRCVCCMRHASACACMRVRTSAMADVSAMRLPCVCMRLACAAMYLALACVWHAAAMHLACTWHLLRPPCICLAPAMRQPCICHAPYATGTRLHASACTGMCLACICMRLAHVHALLCICIHLHVTSMRLQASACAACTCLHAPVCVCKRLWALQVLFTMCCAVLRALCALCAVHCTRTDACTYAGTHGCMHTRTRARAHSHRQAYLEEEFMCEELTVYHPPLVTGAQRLCASMLCCAVPRPAQRRSAQCALRRCAVLCAAAQAAQCCAALRTRVHACLKVECSVRPTALARKPSVHLRACIRMHASVCMYVRVLAQLQTACMHLRVSTCGRVLCTAMCVCAHPHVPACTTRACMHSMCLRAPVYVRPHASAMRRCEPE